MASPELTVIVACYNVAEFVAACLQSIFAQRRVDRLHVLIIDDGSTDDTAEVVRSEIAARQDVSCELVTQPNQGISGARNTGLRLVRTPYVAFLDSDDLWAPDFLDVVMPMIDQGRADIIAFNASMVDMAGRRVRALRTHSLFSGRGRFSCAQLARDAAVVAEWHTWARIYRTRLLDGISFPDRRYYEDAAVVPTLYVRASHIETLQEELYSYRFRPGSITSSVADKHIDDLLVNASEAAARIPEMADYWRAVRQRMILQIAGEIGRAPRRLRRAMFSRAWPDVRAQSGPGFRLIWIFRLFDVCLRSEVKKQLGWKGSWPSPGVQPPAGSAP
ncbi:MAG: glycosyltransferase [Ramlibacter sp.]|nr:glycosyltransferase [Ramlibacter sp.]